MSQALPLPDLRERSGAARQARALLAAADDHQREGDHHKGAGAAREALALAERAGRRPLQATALASLALHEMRLGETEAAVAHGQRALPLLRRRRDAGARAQLLCTMVMACVDMGLVTDALQYATQAIDAARGAADASLMSWALNRAGVVHEALGDAARGAPLLEESLRIAREIDGREEMFSALNNLCSNQIGVARALAGEDKQRTLEKSLEFGALALALACESGNRHREAIVESNLATANVELGRYDEALRHIAREQEISEGRGYRAISVGALSNRAALERHRGNLEASIAFHRQALAQAHEVEDRALLFEMHRGLYECHKERREFEPALEHHEAMRRLEREQLTQVADRQARLLLNRVELEHAQSAVERARIDAEVQRLRATTLEDENAKLVVQADELGKSAQEDQLTGLANRRRVDRELPAQLAWARERGEPLSIALADLDHFKLVNDRHGHAVGDDVLRGVARMLMENTRGADLVARMGGEEFLVVMVGTPLEAAAEICERLRLAVAEQDWSHLAERLHVTVSIGLCEAAVSTDVRDLLARADALLYAAKRGGRNRVVAQWGDPGAASKASGD
jgi:diguanylate cyclase (GGDEF)-like protein